MKIQHRLTLALMAMTALTGLVRAAEPQVATPVVAARPDRPATIPFELYRGNRVYVTGRVNGIDSEMVLDTGASVTAIDRKFEARLGLTGGQAVEAEGAGGAQGATLYQDVSLEVGGLRLAGVTIVALDLAPIEKRIGRAIPVILGRDFFGSAVVGLDFEARTMTVHSPTGFVADAGAREVKLEAHGPLFKLPVTIDGEAAMAMLDLGSGGAISLSSELIRARPRLARLPTAASVGGGVGGLREGRVTTLPGVTLAGFAFEAVPAEFGTLENGPYAGMANVGIELMKPFVVTLDLGNQRLFLQRSAAPIAFARNRVGIKADLEGDALAVVHVAPGSPAATSGLKVGDRIRMVGERAVTPDFYRSERASWVNGAPGSQVALALTDGRTVTVTLADYY